MGRLGNIVASGVALAWVAGCGAELQPRVPELGRLGEPPQLAVQPTDAPVVAGIVELSVTSEVDRLRASVDVGEPFDVSPPTVALDTTGWADGAHAVTFTASTLLGGSSQAAVAVVTDNTPPGVALWEAGTAVEQGHTLPIVLRVDEPAELSVTFLGEERALYPVGEGNWRALVGVPIRAEPGPHPLRIVARDSLGNTAELGLDVEVTAVSWPFTGKLPLSKRKATVPEPEMVQMRAERDAVYATASPEQRWAGPMRVPVDGGEHTSPFGTYREYPDGRRSHHDAEDLARKRWTPIFAAADGTVALARYQAVHGNAVLIDHGQQVISLYSHLQKHDVVEGQEVRAGDRLGWMGSTGRSTGPHLHWGVVVDEVPVDPMQWTETGFEPGPDGAFVALGRAGSETAAAP